MIGSIGMRRMGASLGLAMAMGFVVPAMAAPDQVATWSGKMAPLATPWTAEVSPRNALPDYPRPQLARPSLAHPQC
ncbi:hypothetical protein [Rhodanobacter sp. 115]|uniref:hypothetical protein n=1 Tax=Rhodanobacter sp. FW021-MT20 TaxID=1162282 RepID=UPI000260C9B1|nr:hypothetical protein [Rhodanobacter sp. 115]EIL96512.1 alpha-L-arabinofuranosidase B [Rhodanobacter sp. 115]